MSENLKVLVIGAGNMGSSHARAYHHIDGFEVVGLVELNAERRNRLAEELGGVTGFHSLDEALQSITPDVVSVCSYPDTHFEFGKKALEAGAHVFMEKPLAATVEDAVKLVELASMQHRKIVVGYILRHSPSWITFIEKARELGKPLYMRMNLNQQSTGKNWETHKMQMKSMSPIVDCGVHYVDVMCQMTRSRPVRVQAIGIRLSDEIDPDMYNHGQLQVIFEDGSVGWYEAGWGPMISETAFFVKDVSGPKGCVSIVENDTDSKGGSSDIESHTKTNRLRVHLAELDDNGSFKYEDQFIDTSEEPDHQELCNREQRFLLEAIREDLDLTDHLEDAVNSLRIVLAADVSVRTGNLVDL